MKDWIKFLVTAALLFVPFIIALIADNPVWLGLYVPSLWVLTKFHGPLPGKKSLIIAMLAFTALASNAQFSGKMYERALPEQTLSISVHPMSKGFGIMFDHMVFSTQAMMYYTIAADNFGVENSEATWPEHLSASIGLQYCTPERDPKDPQLRAGFGIKYSSLHTVNGCQSPTIDLSDFRPELKIAVRIEKWLTFGVRVDLWEANSAVDLGISF